MNSSLEPHWNRHTSPLIFVSSGPNSMWKLFLRVQIHLLCAKNRKSLHSILSQGSSEFSKRFQSQSCKSTRRLQLWILVRVRNLRRSWIWLFHSFTLFLTCFHYCFLLFFIIASANSWVGLHPLFSSVPPPSPPVIFASKWSNALTFLLTNETINLEILGLDRFHLTIFTIFLCEKF